MKKIPKVQFSIPVIVRLNQSSRQRMKENWQEINSYKNKNKLFRGYLLPFGVRADCNNKMRFRSLSRGVNLTIERTFSVTFVPIEKENKKVCIYSGISLKA